MHKPDVDVAIIGAGFAGLGAAIRLLQTGQHSFVVFERADEVGGTWRENTYPGCACDVPSHLYSFSFAPNPHWSQKYSPQPEILGYLKNCVERYNLRPHIRYNTEIIRTEFLEDQACWRITDRAGNVLTARVVVGATGPLNRPSVPKLKGFDVFTGKTFHSANWDHSVDLRGKRVAVVGTGASAIQIVPEVAKLASQLYVFQRTAPYVTPRMNSSYSSTWQGIYKRFPGFQKAHREFIYGVNELFGLAFTGNNTLNKLATYQSRKHLEAAISDPELRQKATPNYKIGCKRILVSDDYYPALARPNVDLVTDRITELSPTGIVTNEGTERPVDVIIFSTGFVVADIICDLQITGLNGHNLFEQWLKTGAEAYKGITTAGYPNLLFLLGPNTGLGHNSVVHMIESQVNYLIDYLRLLKESGEGAYLDVKPDVQQAYNDDLQKRLVGTVWSSGCQSWYMNGAGRNTTIWPALNSDYRKITRRVDAQDYIIRQRVGEVSSVE
ncbi:MAG: NAD(P)/FAD-dependent oxidoreductase [Cytophagales bacterium]|nr:MAG: NAD(P)/FAD-dependent oxidoreductase [Cytophagales bacterium]